MNLTVSALRAVLPRAPAPWLAIAIEQMPTYGIDTQHEVASFLAQVAHESVEFTRLEENLNYSAARMAQVWKRFAANPDEKDLAKRQPNDLALRYQHNPEALANYVYARRMGNGDESSGDGWRHRGVGPIQITGKYAQTACAKDLGIPLSRFHDELTRPFNGIRSACWYWKTYDLDAVDDDDDVRLDTRRINGGETGLAERQRYFSMIILGIA